MTKEELIQYSAEEVRKTPHLFLEFERLYLEQYGYGCAPCQFKTTFSAWKSQTQINDTIMKNTFLLKKPTSLYRVDEDTVLSKNSPDEVALAWLSLESYAGNKTTKEGKESIFSKLPEGYGDDQDLDKKTVAQLKEVAAGLELPEEEYKDLKKADLIAYLSDKV